MIYLNDVGGNGLGKPRKGFKKFLKVAKIAVAPHTLLLNKKKRKPTIASNTNNDNVDVVASTAESVYDGDVGLGKSKLLKKIKLKGVIKGAKFLAPIAAGFIPVGGGVASKLLDSKLGKGAMKLGKSKVGSAVLSQAGINLPDSAPAAKAIPVKKKKGFAKVLKKKKTVATPRKTVATNPKPKGKFPLKFKKKSKQLAIGSKGEEVKELQEKLGIEPDGDFGPKTQQALKQATGKTSITTEDVQSSAQTQAMEEAEPQGELTPIKPYEESLGTQAVNTTKAAAQGAPKNNTLLYVGGAVALAGIAFLATRKK